MTSHYRSRITRLEKEIADLDRDAAAAAKKEADLIGKLNRAQDAVSKASSVSSAKSKVRQLERASKDLAAIKGKQSDISRKRSQKTQSLLDYQSRQARDDDKARKKAVDEERRLMRDRETHQRRMSLEVKRQDLMVPTDPVASPPKPYDFFICHASEDKDDFVRELAELLRAKGARVWYDEFALRVGSRLRREIDRGLVSSRFGIVVVSKHFFAKEWPQRELDGLFSLDSSEQSQILPIWHRITKDEVTRHSPILADIMALNTGVQSTLEIAGELLALIQ